MKKQIVFSFISLILIIGCQKKPAQTVNVMHNSVVEKNVQQVKEKSKEVSVLNIVKDNKEETTAFKPFYVFTDKGSKDNHYIPSGFMPDGKCLVLNDAWSENCYNGKTCMKMVYDVECSKQGQQWAGIYWLNPANNWGRMKGGYNLTGAQKLTFWAKGDVGGEQIQEFTIGGIEGDYPDSDKIVIGPVILSNQWKEYEVDLRGRDLSYISGGFAWSTEASANPAACTFYIDEIKFE